MSGSDKTSLGDRMKQHESVYRAYLPRKTYTILRLDGRSFHTYLKNADKPFDFRVIEDMQNITRKLCKDISGSIFGYTQSDEISILLQDFATNNTEPWFGGNIQKIVSISASLATLYLAQFRPEPIYGSAVFDARVFSLSTRAEVANYFLWRQQDAVRNSISMAASAYFSPSQLQYKNSNDRQEMLWSQKGVNWNSYPTIAKRGSMIVKTSHPDCKIIEDKATGLYEKIEFNRSEWEAMEETPHFTADPDGELMEWIPSQPGACCV